MQQRVPPRKATRDAAATALERAKRAAQRTHDGRRAWQRNAAQVGVDWHFTTEDARIRLQRPCPKTAY